MYNSARMLVARNRGHSLLWHLYTIFFPAREPVSCVMSVVKDLLFRENSCNTELCICWPEEINSWPSEIARMLRKRITKFGGTDSLVVVGHQESVKQFPFKLVFLDGKNKSFPSGFKSRLYVAASLLIDFVIHNYRAWTAQHTDYTASSVLAMQTPSDTVGSNSCEDVIIDFHVNIGCLKDCWSLFPGQQN